MGTLFIYRVNRTKAECVWAGHFGSREEGTYPLPAFLEACLTEYIAVPKEHAHRLAKMVWPYGDDAAKMIEAYPFSVNHACVQEMGIGLSLGCEKWTKGWPQVSWKVLDRFVQPGTDAFWETTKHEWSVEQLNTQRKKRQRMPRGLDKAAWDMLGDLRLEHARKAALRSK